MSEKLKEKEMLEEAIGLYIEESAEEYKKINETAPELPSRLESKMKKIIKQRKKPFYRLFNTVTKRVACVATALLVVAACTVVGVDASREKNGSYSLKKFTDTVRLCFDTDGDEPKRIETYYGPGYIPEGYEMYDILRSTTSYNIEYKNNKEDRIIRYDQITLSGSDIIVNTENAKEIKELENGFYVYYNRTQSRGYHWSDGKYRYSITVHDSISEEEMYKIADSLKDEQYVGPF